MQIKFVQKCISDVTQPFLPVNRWTHTHAKGNTDTYTHWHRHMIITYVCLKKIKITLFSVIFSFQCGITHMFLKWCSIIKLKPTNLDQNRIRWNWVQLTNPKWKKVKLYLRSKEGAIVLWPRMVVLD